MRKVSVHIGLNQLNTNAYGGWDGKLNGCINDSENMSSVFFKNGYKCYLLHDDEATTFGVTGLLESIISELESKDRLVITYSGHGTQRTDQSGDERDKKDEAWCLFDGLLIDDQIYNILSKAKRGVRILVLSDSCHSGTITRGEIKGKSRNAIKGIADLFHWDTLPWNHKKKAISLISGCKDSELSYEVDGQGVFTKNVVEILKTEGNISPRKLHRILKKRIADYQTPQLTSLGYRVVERKKIFG